MLKYLVIQLCDSSASICHYESRGNARLIALDNLRRGLLWAVKRGLYIQVAYPDYELPTEYIKLLRQFQHVSMSTHKSAESDVRIFNDWDSFKDFEIYSDKPIIIRTTLSDFISGHMILNNRLARFSRVNIVFKDIPDFNDADIESYQEALMDLAETIVRLYESGNRVQLNLLTDRFMLSEMNNCNAGVESITLAPDGGFYLCPAFYFDYDEAIGNTTDDVTVPNMHLMKLDYAPICRICDAYHCKRCIWMNKKSTLEVNTPGHQQCVIAHMERLVSKFIREKLSASGLILPGADIPDLGYLDPFDKITKIKEYE